MEHEEGTNIRVCRRVITCLQAGTVGSLFILHAEAYFDGSLIHLIAAYLLAAALYYIGDGNKELTRAFYYSLFYAGVTAAGSICFSIFEGSEWNTEGAMIVMALGGLCLIMMLHHVKKGIETVFYTSSILYDMQQHMDRSQIALVGIIVSSFLLLRYQFAEIIVLYYLCSSVFVVIFIIELERIKMLLPQCEKICFAVRSKKCKRKFYILMSAEILLTICLTVIVRNYVAERQIVKDSTIMQDRNEELLNQMEAAGFPKDILKNLSREEISHYEGAKKVDVLDQKIAALDVKMIITSFDEQSKWSDTVRILYYGSWEKEPVRPYTDRLDYSSTNLNLGLNEGYACYQDNKEHEIYYKMEETAGSRNDQAVETKVPRYYYVIPKAGQKRHFVLADSYKHKALEKEKMVFELDYYHMTGFSANPWSLSGTYEKRQYRFDVTN